MAYQCTECGRISHSENKPGRVLKDQACPQNSDTMSAFAYQHRWEQVQIGGSGGSSSGSSSSPSKEIDHEAIASSRADEAAAKAEKARVDLEKDRHDDEMALKRRQQELEEKKNRQRRADELRAQGKTTQAFFVEFGTYVYIGAFVLFVGLFIGYQELMDKSNTKSGTEINLKLEGIEDQVKIAIQEGNKEKALKLVNQLIHPLHEDDKTKHFDSWNGYPKFDEEWNKKREEYKEQIMAMDVKPTNTRQDNFKSVEEPKTKQQEELNTDVNTSTKNDNSFTEGKGVANKEKVYFYEKADLSTIGKAYIELHQEVKILGVEGDFFKVEFTNPSGRITSGYMLQNQIDK